MSENIHLPPSGRERRIRLIVSERRSQGRRQPMAAQHPEDETRFRVIRGRLKGGNRPEAEVSPPYGR